MVDKRTEIINIIVELIEDIVEVENEIIQNKLLVTLRKMFELYDIDENDIAKAYSKAEHKPLYEEHELITK